MIHDVSTLGAALSAIHAVYVDQIPALAKDAQELQAILGQVKAAKATLTTTLLDRLRSVSKLQSSIREFNQRVVLLRQAIVAHVRCPGA